MNDKALTNIVGDDNVATDEFTKSLYGLDLAPIPGFVMSLFNTTPDAVVRPETTEQVSEIVEYAHKNYIPLIPRGSACSGYGGAIPVEGGIVLDMIKMDKILEVDLKEQTVTVQSGAFYQTLIENLERKGVTLASYPSSAPVSTVAGWISTGGLGIGSLKYGHVIEQIIELEVVLPNGEIVQVSKGNPQGGVALDWFVGSEGTLGIITKVKLRLKEQPEAFSPHGICFDDFSQLQNAILRLVGSQHIPYTIEYFDREFLDIKRSLSLFAPNVGGYAVLAFEGETKEVEQSEKFLVQLLKKSEGTEIRPETAEEEWEDRFFPLRIGRADTTLLPLDIIAPLNSYHKIVERIMQLKSKYDVQLGIYGSVVSREETTIMPMALADERMKMRYLTTLPLLKDMTELSIKEGGKPYGIGLWNSFYLRKTYDEKTIDEFKRRKNLLDTNDIMNPGKFFRAQTRFGFSLPPFLYGSFMSLFKHLRPFTK